MGIKFYEDFYRMDLMTDDELEEVLTAKTGVTPGIYVFPNRTDANWFHHAVSLCSALTIVRGTPQILFAFGLEHAKLLAKHQHVGFHCITQRE